MSDSVCDFFIREHCISIQIVNCVRNFYPKHWSQAKERWLSQESEATWRAGWGLTELLERCLPLTIPKWSERGGKEGALGLNTTFSKFQLKLQSMWFREKDPETSISGLGWEGKEGCGLSPFKQTKLARWVLTYSSLFTAVTIQETSHMLLPPMPCWQNQPKPAQGSASSCEWVRQRKTEDS